MQKLKAGPNLLTRSLLAISAVLTPSAAFVPARITAERGEKGQDISKGIFTEQHEECDLNDARSLCRAQRTVLARTRRHLGRSRNRLQG